MRAYDRRHIGGRGVGGKITRESMATVARPPERLALRLLTAADALCNRLYGQRFNPLYQSGTIVVALYLVIVVTGLWLTVFYRVGAPWESVARLTGNPWTGNWVRGLHRYSSDLAVIATAVHAIRMFAQGRSWGPRVLAWVTGCVLLLLLFICGWTGYVMVWDTFGGHLAREGARMLDMLPFLSEPTSRAFTGEQPVSTVFFFLNLFAHIGIPLVMGVVFWLHIKRLQRPLMLPPRSMMWAVIGLLAATAIVRPLEMAPQADPFVLPAEIPADFFFAFWMPIARGLSGGQALLLAGALGVGLLVVPWFTARRGAASPPPSVVDEDLCVGCVQCSIDCPYGAIEMVERTGRRSELVARVDPGLCVSCGICAGSCSPMGVGPAGRTGRDQMAGVREFLADPVRRPAEIVVICCDHGAGTYARDVSAAGGVPFPIDCGGNLHTSVIEILLRGGAAGVMIMACPPRDCRHREGPRWLNERVYHEREAELQARVNRARVRIAYVNAHERTAALESLRAFVADVAALPRTAEVEVAESDTRCEPVVAETGP
jgi:coenzyme F420-reducing hydrogenase delta subunit/Pyruvate/2-oxoacid:ferredoxin oxidoreductase delta subunit